MPEFCTLLTTIQNARLGGHKMSESADITPCRPAKPELLDLVQIASTMSADPHDENYMGHNQARARGLAKCICDEDPVLCPFHGR